MAQQLQAGLVRPLQVVEHQHDRLVLRHHGQQPDDRREELVALGVGVGRRRRRQPGQPARQAPGPTGPAPSRARPDVGDELLLGGVGDEVAERFGEQLVRGGEVLLAVPEQHTGALVERDPGRLGDQRRLAETGLTRDEQHLPALARGDALERIQHRRQLGVPARRHRPPGRTARRAGSGTTGPASDSPSGSQQHLDRLHRIGQALQGRARPSGRQSWRLRRPAINRTMSAARICPLSQRSHSRAASMTGSPK